MSICEPPLVVVGRVVVLRRRSGPRLDRPRPRRRRARRLARPRRPRRIRGPSPPRPRRRPACRPGSPGRTAGRHRTCRGRRRHRRRRTSCPGRGRRQDGRARRPSEPGRCRRRRRRSCARCPAARCPSPRPRRPRRWPRWRRSVAAVARVNLCLEVATITSACFVPSIRCAPETIVAFLPAHFCAADAALGRAARAQSATAARAPLSLVNESIVGPFGRLGRRFAGSPSMLGFSAPFDQGPCACTCAPEVWEARGLGGLRGRGQAGASRAAGSTPSARPSSAATSSRARPRSTAWSRARARIPSPSTRATARSASSSARAVGGEVPAAQAGVDEGLEPLAVAPVEVGR